MKLSDYIVEWLYLHGISDFFGYQGTMIAHLVDSIGNNHHTKNHSCYNEQSAAFAACSYAIVTEKCSVAYATSGPGAINLISGIANAFYDSIPVIFITGQINTYEYRNDLPSLRQNAFQETKIVDIVNPITKYSVCIQTPERIRFELEKAFHLANSGRKGPVLLDIPMNIQRAEIYPEKLEAYVPEESLTNDTSGILSVLKNTLSNVKRPVLLLGNGISRKDFPIFIQFAQTLRIPIVTSLLAKGHIPFYHELNFGYLGGAYGHRYANMIVAAKSDQLIAIGMSLCTRQTGTNISAFAPKANVLRFDLDPEEIKRKIKANESSFLVDSSVLAALLHETRDEWSSWQPCDESWLSFCRQYRNFCKENDDGLKERYPNKVIQAFNPYIRAQDIVVSDVGQHMMWVAQSVENKGCQPIIFSGGHGAMGFALPASIGAALAIPGSTVFCFCGDGSFQMNIQELQWVFRMQSPIVMIVLNNHSLGLITQQQDAYFNGVHHGSDEPDYAAPSFSSIAKAYGIKATTICSIQEIPQAMAMRSLQEPLLIEYIFNDVTRAYPKTVLGEPIYNQEPLLPQQVLSSYLNDTDLR